MENPMTNQPPKKQSHGFLRYFAAAVVVVMGLILGLIVAFIVSFCIKDCDLNIAQQTSIIWAPAASLLITIPIARLITKK